MSDASLPASPPPGHDTPHPYVLGKFIPHVGSARQKDGTWACPDCGCPHEYVPVPDSDPPSVWIVASEARRCPSSFETPCPDCGQCYECALDCSGMAGLLGALGANPDVYVAGGPDPAPVPNGPPPPPLEWFSAEHTEAEMEAAGLMGWASAAEGEKERWKGEYRLWLFPARWAHQSAIPEGLPVVSISGKRVPFVREHHIDPDASRFGALAVGLLCLTEGA